MLRPVTIQRLLLSLAWIGSPACEYSQYAQAQPPAAASQPIKLERVPPVEADKALDTLEVAPGFEVELVAAEPLVVDPVAMAFDERHRLYVVEMRDYSERDKERLGRVRLLSDEDGDGTYEKSQVFAEDLSWPTAITCYDGGVFVGNSPDILYLKDHNGDGVADANEGRVVFTGFGRDNVQGLLNSFQWGLDGRIHGSASSTGGNITRTGDKSSTLSLQGRDFAFDPKTLEIKATTGGGQHGMTFNRWADRFVCHNSDHLQAIVFEERYLARNPYQSIVSARRSIAADGPQAPVFRASPVEAWRVARTNLRLAGLAPGPIEGGGRAAGYFTSGTGVTVYEGGMFDDQGEPWVFIADVGSNLIHRKRLLPDGVTFRGERIDRDSEFIRSTDIWFRPVQMAIGPEGALYVADMYRETIEHPMSLPPELKSQLDLSSGNDRGRIYRVAPSNYSYSRPQPLADASTTQLANALNDANQWRRMTALRLLAEQSDPKAAGILRITLRTAERPESTIAMLYALRTAGGLKSSDVISALADSHPRVRCHALVLAEPMLDASPELLTKALAVAADEDPMVQFQLALTLGESSHRRATEGLAKTIIRNVGQRDIVDAALTSIGARAGDVLRLLLADDKWLSGGQSQPVLTAIVGQIVRQRHDEDVAVLLEELKASTSTAAGAGTVALLRALSKVPADVLAGKSPELRQLQNLRKASAATLVQEAWKQLEEQSGPLEQRVAAIENLAFDSFASAQPLFEQLLLPQEPAAVHAAVLKTCAEFDSPEVAVMVLAQWDQLAPTQRAQATDLLLRRASWAAALLSYLKEQNVPVSTLDPGHVARLENYPSPDVQKLARSLRGQHIAQDRQQVFEDYRQQALAGGDIDKGKLIFEKNCASCHRLGDVGIEIGPNLAAMISRGAESVLFNVLAPNGDVDPRYLEYSIITADGQVLSGVIAGETSTAVTLRSADNKLTTILRVDLDEMHNTGKSLMPEGFEKLIDKAAMADLISFLQGAAATQEVSK